MVMLHIHNVVNLPEKYEYVSNSFKKIGEGRNNHKFIISLGSMVVTDRQRFKTGLSCKELPIRHVYGKCSHSHKRFAFRS